MTPRQRTGLGVFVSFLAAALVVAGSPALAAAQHSVARIWNEQLLDAIRTDRPKPPVHARNLFHLSVAMWDAWAAYDAVARGYVSTEKSPLALSQLNGYHAHAAFDAARAETISFAAYRVLTHRFPGGGFSDDGQPCQPGAAASLAAFDAQMDALGYDRTFTSSVGDSPAALGNRIGQAVIQHGLTDGANENFDLCYTDDSGYYPINAECVFKLPGTQLNDPNHWQPLAFDYLVLQNGIVIGAAVQSFVGVGWGDVAPFALTAADRGAPGTTDCLVDLTAQGLPYLDPGCPPQLGGVGDEAVRDAVRELIFFEASLDPRDGVQIDISPGAPGFNNPLGTDAGAGHPLNPFTGKPYPPNVVLRADAWRVIAEFWADGPHSETPPGHWNTLFNYVTDQLPGDGDPDPGDDEDGDGDGHDDEFGDGDGDDDEDGDHDDEDGDDDDEFGDGDDDEQRDGGGHGVRGDGSGDGQDEDGDGHDENGDDDEDVDVPIVAGAKRIGGTGEPVGDLEWDVKGYLALNGAQHDAAIAAWTAKHYYDSARPISLIRYMGGLGQSSDSSAPSYHPDGLPLEPGLIELITAETTAPGGRHEHLAAFCELGQNWGKPCQVNADCHDALGTGTCVSAVGQIAIRAWNGSPANPQTELGGVSWRRAVTWMPFQAATFVTPPFPGYTSGHSTYSRAGAAVLAAFTGSSYFPGGLGTFAAERNQYLTFEEGPQTDVVLQWATYFDAADQAGISRRLGGIHPFFDDFPARAMGASIGEKAWLRAHEYYGTAAAGGGSSGAAGGGSDAEGEAPSEDAGSGPPGGSELADRPRVPRLERPARPESRPKPVRPLRGNAR